MLPAKSPEVVSRELKAQQIKGWTGSETDKTSSDYHPPQKIKFPLAVALVAACCADDKNEFKRILDLGVDINTRNPDGLTCVHQCCINGDYEFLEFLIKEGADLNVQDNEGWTPLHAAASVGYEELVRLLLDNGADVSLLSCEMELPVDVSQSTSVIELLTEAMRTRGIDPAEARQTEVQSLERDAQHWLSIGRYEPIVDPRTGTTPLHVAACKDYVDALKMLLQIPGVDINCQDFDGWTPLHAAAHWNCEESARLLADAGARFDIFTFTNQSVFDVADRQIVLLLRQLRGRQPAPKQDLPSTPSLATQPERTLPPIPVDESSSSSASSSEEESDDSDASIKRIDTPSTLQPQKLADAKASGDGTVQLNGVYDALVNASSVVALKDKMAFDETENISPIVPEVAVSAVTSPTEMLGVSSSVATSDTWPHEIVCSSTDTSVSPSEPTVSIETMRRSASPPSVKQPDVVPTVGETAAKLTVAQMDTEPKIATDVVTAAASPAVTNGPVSNVIPSTPDVLVAARKEPTTKAIVTERINSMRLRKSSKEHSPPPSAQRRRSPSPTKTLERPALAPSATQPTPTVASTTRPTPAPTTTINSARIVTVRKRAVQPSTDAAGSLPADATTVTSTPRMSPPKATDDLATRRISVILSPAKSGETETQRSVKARYVRSTRRSTQGVSAEEVAEAKKLVNVNNNASNRSAAATTVATVVPDEQTQQPPQPATATDAAAAPTATRLRSDKGPVVRIARSANRLNLSSATPDSPIASATVSATPPAPAPAPVPFTIGRTIESLRPYRRPPPDGTEDRPNDRTSKSPITSSSTTARVPPSALDTTSKTVQPSKTDAESTQSTTRSFSDTRSTYSGPPLGDRDTRAITSSGSVSENSYNKSDLSARRPRPRLQSALDAPTLLTYTGTPSSSTTTTSSTNHSDSSTFLPSKILDYRKLYEREKAEKERLMNELDRFTRENAHLRSQLARIVKEDVHAVNNAVVASSLTNSSPGSEDSRLHRGVRHIRISGHPPKSTVSTRHLHNRLQHHEDQLKELNQLREDNAKMREENGALIRVISRLSQPM